MIAPLLVLLQVACAQLQVTQWAAPEITGGTAQQRLTLRQEIGSQLHGPFNLDKDMLRAICDRAKRQVGTELACSLVFESETGAHYLVDISATNGAGRKVAADFTSSQIASPRVREAGNSVEKRVTGALALAKDASLMKVVDGLPSFEARVEGSVRAEALELVATANETRQEMVYLLNHSQDVQSRQVSVFLMGWLRLPDAALRDLLPAIRDPDETVRNSASLMAALLVPAGSSAVQSQWAKLWCAQMAHGLYTDKSKALLGLARLSSDSAVATGHACRQEVEQYAGETSMFHLRSHARKILNADDGRPDR